MDRCWPRWFRTALLAACVALLSGCDEGGGVGLSVGLPASYGGMELGLSTTQWSGGPTW